MAPIARHVTEQHLGLLAERVIQLRHDVRSVWNQIRANDCAVPNEIIAEQLFCYRRFCAYTDDSDRDPGIVASQVAPLKRGVSKANFEIPSKNHRPNFACLLT